MKNILMNFEMTKAILDGRKVQTRRAIKYGNYLYDEMNDLYIEFAINYCDLDEKNNPELKSEMIKHCKYRIGETIWVREPARVTDVAGERMVMDVEYLSDGKKVVKQIPERFIDMSSTGQIIENFDLIKAEWIRDCKGIPNGCIKEMARIFLKITDIRVERLQDISDDTDNFMSEGFSHDSYEIGETLKNKMYSNDTHGECDFEDDCMHDWWINLWNKTAPKGYKWEDNPYVFVYEFEKVEASK